MTKAEVLAAFPINSTVKPKDGTPFMGKEATGKVAHISGYQVAMLSGIRYMVYVIDNRGRTLGEYHPHELERA
jgi:hypothetical protein